MLRTYFLIISSALLCVTCATSPAADTSEQDSSAEHLNADSDNTLLPTDSNINDETDSSTDADTAQADTSCDGENVDCYNECWQCAVENECQNEVNACKADAGCNAYLTCKESQCCPNGTCLTGVEREMCMMNCIDTHEVQYNSRELYLAMDRCIACDSCAISCAQNEAQHFAMCSPGPTEPGCYGDGACFDWAERGGGPCAMVVATCHGNDACATLEECIDNSWENGSSYDNAVELEEECFSAAGTEAEEAYWIHLRCIYCDTCELECEAYWNMRTCDVYIPSN